MTTNEFGENTGEVPKLEIRLQRIVQKQKGDPCEHLREIAQASIEGIQRYWYVSAEANPIKENDNGSKTVSGIISFFRSKVNTQREGEHLKNIRSNIERECVKAHYKANPWIIIDESGNAVTNSNSTEYMLDPFEGEFISWTQYKEYFDARKDHLWNASDEVIARHPCFTGIYGLGAQIRMCMDAIYQAVSTEGKVCHHILLWGEPGAAKTTVGLAICEWLQLCIPSDLGVKSSAWINIDSATGPGLRNSFLKKWRSTGIPPIIGFEEAEKVGEDVWKCMLGGLDSRQRMMVLHARQSSSAATRFLAIAIVNNKSIFDKFLGGYTENGEIHPGPLSSRFSTKVEVARPDQDTMYEILMREINTYGWEDSWADAAMNIAKELKTNDPREILRFLDGKERLLDGSYLKDIVATRMAREKNKSTYNMERESSINDFYNVMAQTAIEDKKLKERYAKGILG